MGPGTKALACVGCVLVGHALAAVLAPGLYGWAWSWPGAVAVVSAAAWLLAYAVAITPEQRRDTRGSAHPFQCGSMIVQVTVLQGPPAVAGRSTLPPASSPPSGGLPPVVDGDVIRDGQDRRETGRGDDE